jgi:hypothetical protein
MEKISPPVRILAIVLVLAGLAGMLMLRTMGPSAEPVAAPLPAPVKAAEATPAKTAKVTPAKTVKAAPKPAKAAAPKPVNAPRPKPVAKPPVPPTGFPTVVDRALRQHEVLVVSLVVPGARVDELAAAEAAAGAALGGAGFLALNVLNEDVARSLLTKLDVVQDPSVLVLRRSGEIALELTGFVDRETVAQAAANAAP